MSDSDKLELIKEVVRNAYGAIPNSRSTDNVFYGVFLAIDAIVYCNPDEDKEE